MICAQRDSRWWHRAAASWIWVRHDTLRAWWRRWPEEQQFQPVYPTPIQGPIQWSRAEIWSHGASSSQNRSRSRSRPLVWD
jgi:hypothetical protein